MKLVKLVPVLYTFNIHVYISCICHVISVTSESQMKEFVVKDN